jgi:Glycosyltransferase family 87
MFTQNCGRVHLAATVAVWLALAACVYSIASDHLAQWDFQVYYTAAHAFASGTNPYVPLHPHPHMYGNAIFQYPPLTLYLFEWTRPLSLASAKLLWLLLKLGAFGALAWIWHRDFERLDAGWPVVLFIALGFNATLLRDFVSGNISTFEQLGIWFGFVLLLRNRPYWAAIAFACVAQFKLLPVAFIGLIPLLRPRDGWRPLVAGCVVFLGLLALNPALSPHLTHDYLTLFSDSNLRMDDRGIVNPSSLAMFRDLIDLTAYAPGLSYNVAAGTNVYIVYLAALVLVLAVGAWSTRFKLRGADPRLVMYFGCALFAVAMPRMKDYSYILLLIPALFAVRDVARRGVPPNYLLIGLALMVWGQPQQTNVPGLQALIYMLQAYLPWIMAACIMVYTLSALLRTRSSFDPDERRHAPATAVPPV